MNSKRYYPTRPQKKLLTRYGLTKLFRMMKVLNGIQNWMCPKLFSLWMSQLICFFSCFCHWWCWRECVLKPGLNYLSKELFFSIFGSIQEPYEATGLFIVVFVWFLSFISNELRQFHLAWKNKNIRQAYLTTTISGNIVDILSYLFFLIAFILHLTSYSVHATDYPQRPLVIHPLSDQDDFILYCPFILPTYLVIAQAFFHNFNIWCYSSKLYFLYQCSAILKT